MRVCLHVLRRTLVEVLDEAKVEGTAAVLIALKLRDGCLSSLSGVESNDSGTP